MSDDETVLGEPVGPDRSARSDRPERIGSYRLLRKLGEGGMGEVYQAEQEQPVRRVVALKLIKWGMDTRQVIARFESERQALALMNHANIAGVFDAGATETGRPYFVMEYVEGIPVDEYCESHHLRTREKLELFLEVCDGVQHAHQKGIIHRDIKPSNILVRIQNGRPTPKIIDFGVAKATTGRAHDRTMVTELGQIVGTPAYMSPEQAEMSGADVDTRSDVYSLGVLLYKLLVGTVPFDVQEKGIDEIRRTIREKEPERPSTRAGETVGRSAAAVVERGALVKRLRGDLDWITMKALEKQPSRRYASVSEMAADVRRHLQHQPVVASPPSTRYRMAKFIRRHRTGVAAGALVAVALVVGAAVATVGWIRALRAEVVASQEAQAAREISDFMVGLFAINDPNEARGNSITAREILDQGAKQIRTGLAGQPLSQARAMDTIGRVYASLGLYSEAGPLLAEALAIRERESPDSLEVAASHDKLAQLSDSLKDYDAALEQARRALAIREKTLPHDHPELTRSMHNVANGLWRTKDFDGAGELFDRVVAIRERVAGPVDSQLASSLHGKAGVLKWKGELAAAKASYQRALAIQLETLGPDHPEVARTLGDLANLLEEMGETDGARLHYEHALAIRKHVLGTEHPELVQSLRKLGKFLLKEGDPAAAVPYLEHAARLQERQKPGGEHRDLAATLWDLALAHRGLGDADLADQLFGRSLEIKERSEPEEALAFDRACYHALRGDREAALRWLGQALDLGFSPTYPARDPDLASLHDDPEFRDLLEQARARAREGASR